MRRTGTRVRRLQSAAGITRGDFFAPERSFQNGPRCGSSAFESTLNSFAEEELVGYANNHYAGHAPATIKQFQQLWQKKGTSRVSWATEDEAGKFAFPGLRDLLATYCHVRHGSGVPAALLSEMAISINTYVFKCLDIMGGTSRMQPFHSVDAICLLRAGL
jgi:hypothetical protein